MQQAKQMNRGNVMDNFPFFTLLLEVDKHFVSENVFVLGENHAYSTLYEVYAGGTL